MTSQAVMKRYLTAVSKTEEYANNKTIQNLAIGIANFKKLAKKDQEELNVLIEGAYNKLQAKGFSVKKTPTRTTTTRKTRTTSQGGLKAILAELKKKLGSEKFKEATTGTDIQKDIKIPALKKGKRIVRKKGYTTNQYGTFKNQVGTAYWESRANRFDANQPSQTRKYKLADGGKFDDIYYGVVDSNNNLVFQSQNEREAKHISDNYENSIVKKYKGKGKIHKYAKGGEMKSRNDHNKIIPRRDDDGFYLEGYEPYFRKYVTIATIDESTKVVSPTHGYYPNHPLAKKAIAWAKKNGLQYIADKKKYAQGGKISPTNDYIHIQDLLKILIESKNTLLNEVLSSDYDTPSKRVAKVQINRYFDLILSNLVEKNENSESTNGNKGYSYGDEPYSYTNNFGVDQEDFIKLVDVYHSTNPSNQMDRIVERLTYKEFETKYGEETFNAVMNYIQKIHDFHNKYADGGNTSKLTEAEREQAERELREAWEGKNADDYIMYSDKYKKGGEIEEINIAKQYGKMLNDLSKEKQFNKKIELNSKVKNFEKQNEISIDQNNIIYIKGNRVAYIDKINAKTGQQKTNWEIKKFAQGGTTKRIKRRSC